MSSSTEGSRRMPFSTSRRKRKIGCHCRPSIATIHWISWKLLRFFVAYKILGVARPFHRLPGSSGLPSTCPHVARVSGIGHTPQGIPTWEKRKATPCTLLSKGYANHVRFGVLKKRIKTMITFLRASFMYQSRSVFFEINGWAGEKRVVPCANPSHPRTGNPHFVLCKNGCQRTGGPNRNEEDMCRLESYGDQIGRSPRVHPWVLKLNEDDLHCQSPS